MADDRRILSLKVVLTFQTLMLHVATLGKWVTTHNRAFFLGQELLLDFAAWIDLTLNASCVGSYRTHFASESLKCVGDLWVYQGFMMPINH